MPRLQPHPRRLPCSGDERSIPSPRFNESGLFEFAVRTGHGVDCQPQIGGELANGRQPGADRQLTGGDVSGELRAYLLERRRRR